MTPTKLQYEHLFTTMATTQHQADLEKYLQDLYARRKELEQAGILSESGEKEYWYIGDEIYRVSMILYG